MTWSHDYWPKDRHDEILDLIRAAYNGVVPDWAAAADLVFLADQATHPNRPEPFPGRRELEKRWHVPERTAKKYLARDAWGAKCELAKIPLPSRKLDGPLGGRARVSPPPSPPPSPPKTSEPDESAENVPGGVPAPVPAPPSNDPTTPPYTGARTRLELAPTVPTVLSDPTDLVDRSASPPPPGTQLEMVGPRPAVRRRKKGSNSEEGTEPPSDRKLVAMARSAFQEAYQAHYGEDKLYAFVSPGHDTVRLKAWAQIFDLRKEPDRGAARLWAAALAYFDAVDRGRAFPKGEPATTRWFTEDIGKWAAFGDARLKPRPVETAPSDLDNEAEMRRILGDEEYDRIMAGGGVDPSTGRAVP